MANLTNALQELREERKQAQLHLEKLDQAISVIESLNGSEASRMETNRSELSLPLRVEKWRRRKKRDGQRYARDRSQ